MNQTQMAAKALWYVAPGKAELRPEPLPALREGMCRVKTSFSALSKGTETLVFEGHVPETEWQRMRAPFQAGDFPYPVKYGYALTGRVIEGPQELIGHDVFALHPHQDAFNAPTDALAMLPAGLPPRRAVLAANMETALNALWDSAVAPADRIAVVGAGVVGLLVAYLCSRLPGTEVAIIDIDPAKARVAKALGVPFANAKHGPRDCDVVFHTSGHPAGLVAALDMAGDEASIIEMSWYGERSVALPLGGAFHARRLRLVSSQVGKIAPSHRPRWSYTRRLASALHLLMDERLDALLEPDIAFTDLAGRLPLLLSPQSGILAQVIRY